MLKRLFGGGNWKPSLDSVKLEGVPVKSEGVHNQIRVWGTPEGDKIGLYFFPLEPDLPSNTSTLQEFSGAYGSFTEVSGVSVVDLQVLEIRQGRRVVRTIVKVPQETSGMTYIGSITIPYKDFSFVLKMQCAEHGMTGIREAILLDRGLAEDTVQFSDAGKIEGDWDPDNEKFDGDFPDHPLSRLRRWLPQMQSGILLDPRLSAHEEFPLPV